MLAGRARVAGAVPRGAGRGPIEESRRALCIERGGARRGWFVFVVQLPRGVDRDGTIRALAERGIQSKPYLPAIHLMSFYRERFGHRDGRVPGLRGRLRPLAGAAVLPRDERGSGRARGRRAARGAVRLIARCHASASPSTPDFQRLNASIDFDRRLWPLRRRAVARARAMLAARGIIGADDRDALLAGLDAVELELRDGRFPFAAHDEDIHMAIERRLTELAGPVGGKLHTARSRNDQVATDVAIFMRERAAGAQRRDRRAVPRRARARGGASRLAAARLHASAARPARLPQPPPARLLLDAAARRARFVAVLDGGARLPLGAGALAGVNFDTDRERSPRELGFSGVAQNSIDAVSNRDFVLDYLAAAATCSTHLSRLGAEIVLWSSEEFGFCEVSDAWASGSSIMPQKKNPDAAELLRAKARASRPSGGAARRDARPAADLQQGHAGGQGASVRRRRHARAVARRGARDDRAGSASAASGWRGRGATSCSPRPTSPTCSCKRGHAVPRGPRRRRRARAGRGRQRADALGADRRGAAGARRAARRDELLRAARDGAVAGVEGLRGRDQPAMVGAVSSSSLRRWRRALPLAAGAEPRVLRAPGPRGRARPDRLRRRARRAPAA